VVKIFVEGGGDSRDLRTECRKGFTCFFEKAGLKGTMPRVVACGSRSNAYNQFCTAIKNGEDALLLVDSEDMVLEQFQLPANDPAAWQPWQHLANRKGDHWEKLDNFEETHCHLMVQCMENWFLADSEALKLFFGQGFNDSKLPSQNHPIEEITKIEAIQSLELSTKGCCSGSYRKGKHSFKVLAKVDPSKVIQRSPWANRLVSTLKAKLSNI